MTKKNTHGRVEIDGRWYRLRSNGKPGVELTRACNTMTDAEFFSRILSFARRGTKFWPPAMACKLASKRPYKGSNKLQKWEYQCSLCKKWFKDKEIQIDHIIPLGGINSIDKIKDWYIRAYPEIEGYQMLCRAVCHKIKTALEKKK